MKRGLLRNDNVIGGALALFALAIYAYTAMPSIPSEDAGEIATSLYYLGILHPTGYPLFSLLGHAWIDLPFDGRVIVRLNLMMAAISSVTVFFLYRLFLEMIRRAGTLAAPGKSVSPKAAPVSLFDDGTERLAAAGGALALAFSRIAWTNAGSLEVYSLHVLFLAVVSWLFIQSMPREPVTGSAADGSSLRIWAVFAYALGLSFSNHMMTVLLAPAFLFLFFSAHGMGRPAWIRVGLAIPPFLLGLSPYLYLPVRAAADPLANWGDVTTVPHFLQHVSGAQYRFMMFQSLDTAISKSVAFFQALPSDFGVVPVLLAATGLVELWRRSRRLLAFSLLIFVFGAVYEANYGFPDRNFRLNAHFAVAMGASFGILGIARLLRSRLGSVRVAAILCVLAGAAPLSAHFTALNRHKEYAVEDYAINVLNSVEPGGMILTDEEWTLLFPAMYLQRVEGHRPDVAVIHPSAILIDWNQKYIQRTTPGILDASPEVAQALRTLAKQANVYENAGDLAMNRGTWELAAKRLVFDNLRVRPVHTTMLLFFNAKDFGDLAKEYPGLPVGMTFRLFPDSYPSEQMPMRIPVFHPIRVESEMGVSLYSLYPDVYYNRGVYEVGFLQDTAAAIRSFLKAQELLPGHAMSKEWLTKLGVMR